jgi:zinc/manganese transport system ATP-binding protein
VTPPALSFQDAAVERGGQLVWSDGSFEVPPGAVIVLIGPNGSGKTTLLEVALGLLPLTRGRVEVLGEPARRGNDRVGYVPQNYAATVPEAVRAWDLVALGLAGARFGPFRLDGGQRARVDAALRSVDATAYAHRRMSQLSGGQQQRVAIAQALVDEPELLLLDEPLANLDLRSQHEIVSLLGEIRARTGVTVVVVAHDLNPLLPILTGALYLMDGHPHYDAIGEVVDESLLSHLYGTQIRVVRTAQGDLFTRTT